nr:hypothetical protein [Haloterrigena salina]
MAVFTTAVLVGYLPVLVLLFVGVDGFGPFPFASVLVATLCVGVIYVVIGHSVSAMTESETTASTGGFAAFFLMYIRDLLFSAINKRFRLVDGYAEAFVLRFQLRAVSEDIVNAVRSLGDGDVDGASVGRQ